jgi:very-short-patch-repair endonuclease
MKRKQIIENITESNNVSNDELSKKVERFALFMRNSPTNVEKKIWDWMGRDQNPWGFRCQIPIHGFVLDFFSEVHNVCLEADGPVHHRQEQIEKDIKRDKILLDKGIRTIRLTPMAIRKYGPNRVYEYVDNFIHNAFPPEEKSEKTGGKTHSGDQ